MLEIDLISHYTTKEADIKKTKMCSTSGKKPQVARKQGLVAPQER